MATPSVPASSLPAPGALVARALASGETHEYRAQLDRGDYLAVDVEELGVDVDAELFHIDSKIVAAIELRAILVRLARGQRPGDQSSGSREARRGD